MRILIAEDEVEIARALKILLEKMRWHFILATMAAVFIMLVVVLTGINVWNYHNTSSHADQRIQEIYTLFTT